MEILGVLTIIAMIAGGGLELLMQSNQIFKTLVMRF